MLKRLHKTHSHPLLILAATLAALVATSGCAESEEDVKSITQVVARVNGDEITVHQINNVLERSQNVTPEVAGEAKRQILDKLIDRQLAGQKAIENKLDRSPRVMQAIESAKTEILARAYLEDLVGSLPAPQDWEIEKYYLEHPELFAQRRLFDIEEFVFVADNSTAARLRAQVSEGRSMPQIADWLRSQGINFVANYGTRTAEQTSLEILPRVQTMEAGQIQLLEARGGRLRVIRLVDFESAPVDQATATPRIRQFLLNQRSSEFLSRKISEIKEQAKIEYLGEFAGDAFSEEQKANADDSDKAKVEENAQGR